MPKRRHKFTDDLQKEIVFTWWP